MERNGIGITNNARGWILRLARRLGMVPESELHQAQKQGAELARELTNARRLLGEYERGWPPGHFYSPIPSLEDIRAREAEIFDVPKKLPGIALNEEGQLALLAELGKFHDEHPFPFDRSDETRFFFDNPNYRHGEALALYAMLRLIRPRRVIEVGSGYSSCVVLDTNDRFLEGGLQITFIEPNPELLFSLLRPGDTGKVKIIRLPVQQVDAEVFGELEDSDVLLIDSTHVSKTGSDVNHLFFRVLPTLRAGVYVHFHDIYYPFEYPRIWVYEGRAWNEAYMLRAFLQYNAEFRIVLFNQFLAAHHHPAWTAAFPVAAANPGSSIWLRRMG